MTTESLDVALGDTSLALFDSSSMIGFLNTHETINQLVTHLLKRVEDESDALRGIISTVTATEILVRPYRTGGESVRYVHKFVAHYPNLHVLPVDFSVALQAATLRAGFRLRLPDALIIATGLLAGCGAIVTNDERWYNALAPQFRDFRWIHLSRYL